MSIDAIRNAFKIYSYANHNEYVAQINKILFGAGINYKKFDDLEVLKKEFQTNPPHILLFYFESGCVADLTIFKHISPETHIVVVSSMTHYPEAVSLSSDLIYDCLRFPIAFEQELLKSIDRALSHDYNLYRAEQLEDDLKKIRSREVTEAGFSNWQKDLKNWSEEINHVSTFEEALDIYMKAIVKSLGDCKAVFFKYIENHKTLLATQSVNVNLMKVKGLGIDLKNEPGGAIEAIQNPKGLTRLRELVKTVFSVTKFIPKIIEANNQVLGMIIVFDHEGIDDLDPNLKIKRRIFENVISKVQILKKLHKLNVLDESTSVLNKQAFLNRLAEEISRSRRLRLPVSFLIASIDNLDSFEKDRGREDSEFLIRSIANLLQKNSRTNDIVGRVGNFDFGLLLPHTNQQGATIKAERLRKLISSANFSETIYEAPKVTISVGVSEYPSLSSDADELFESCDEALYQIKKVGPNKICLASVGEHFTPDFSVSEE